MPVKTPTPRRKSPKKWIAEAIDPKKKGQLHKDLGVPPGKPIPAAKLAAAAKRTDVVGKRARLAKTLKGMRKGKK